MMEKVYYKIVSKKRNIFIFLILLTCISSLGFLRSGYVLGSDLNFHLFRIKSVTQNISIGKIIPIYFNQLNGFGYGSGLFYPDLFLYFPACMVIIGINILTSMKIFFILINFFSILSFYICIKKITKSQCSTMVGTVLYAFSLYKFVDIFFRSAIAESLVFIFLPMVILGLYEIIYDDYKQGIFLTIGIVGILFSHIISFYLTCIFCISIILINIKKIKEKYRLLSLIINLIFSLLITSSFWMPFLEQYLFYDFSFYYFSPVYENIIPVVALFMDFPINSLFNEWLPPGIGCCYYIVLYIYFRYKRINNNFLILMFILGLLALLFTCCTPLWKNGLFYKLFSIIQFPWRFYMFATVFLTIGVSIFLKYYKNAKLIKLLIVYSLIIFSINMLLLNFKLRVYEHIGYEIGYGEYLPKGFDIDKIYDYQNKDIDYYRDNEKTFVSIKNSVDSVELPLIYYKGYSACDSDKCYDTYKTENGLVGVNIDKNVTNLEVSYTGTKLYKVSKLISIFGIILFIIYVRRYRGMIVNEKNIHET